MEVSQASTCTSPSSTSIAVENSLGQMETKHPDEQMVGAPHSTMYLHRIGPREFIGIRICTVSFLFKGRQNLLIFD